MNLGVDDQLPLRQATGQVGCQARKPLANEEWDGVPTARRWHFLALRPAGLTPDLGHGLCGWCRSRQAQASHAGYKVGTPLRACLPHLGTVSRGTDTISDLRHASGTDRCAELLLTCSELPHVSAAVAGSGRSLVRTRSEGVRRAVGETTARVEAAIRTLAGTTLSAGDRLPSERTLAEDLGAGRTTVRLVLVKLAAEGLVRAEHGRGYFVCERSS
jgi:hypothetical protein